MTMGREDVVSDADVLMTLCLRLYVGGMRRVVSERLQEHFGQEWWQRGVLSVVDKERRQHLKDDTRLNPQRDPSTSLDAAHFPLITNAHVDQVFPNAFVNRFEAIDRMWNVVHVRNQWAHQQGVPFPRALRAAGCMKDVLLELKCPEALEIEKLIKDYAIEPMAVAEERAMYNVETPIDADDLPDVREALSASGALWRELRGYLQVETQVDMPEDQERGDATVTVRVYNSATSNREAPEVHFRGIAIQAVGGNARRRGDGEISELGPGDTGEVQFTFPARQILGVTFDITGEVDTERYFRFSTRVGLPSEVVEPIQREFIAWLDAMELKVFVEGVEADVTGFHEEMPMNELRSRRIALKRRAEELQEKRENLDRLYRHFRLRGGSTLADRTKELASDMIEFAERLKELDDAMGETDMVKIKAAVRGVQEVHLALLRVEAVVRNTTGG